jgi:hypothetical protein
MRTATMNVRALVFTINSNSATACIHLHIRRLAFILFLPACKYLDSIPSRTYVRIYELKHITILYIQGKQNQFKSQSCPEMGVGLFPLFFEENVKEVIYEAVGIPTSNVERMQQTEKWLNA